MASIRCEVSIRASAEQTWAALRAFDRAHELFAGVLVDCRAEGDQRTVTFANGMVAREQLVDVDEQTRRLAYTVIEGRPTHHNASFQVFATDPTSCRVVWITDLLPHELEPGIAGLMQQGSEALKRTLEAQAASVSVP
jgi:uncharacterized protein YndB with AHSA1/START domain